MIYTGDAGYREAIFFLQFGCVFLFATGLTLMAFPAIRTLRGTRPSIEVLRMFPEMSLRNVLPRAKYTTLDPIHNPPHWPLFFVTVFSTLIFIFMMFGPFPSNGLLVTWRNRNPIVWERSPWPDALEVYVRAPRHFFINGHEVSRADLHAKLIEQLSRRVEWTVYFEAAPDVAYGEAIYAIDTIQGCGANLNWITPKMREAWQQESKESVPTSRKTKTSRRAATD